MRPNLLLLWSSAIALALGLVACGGDAGQASRGDGAGLVGSLGCSTCHSTNGDRKQGPTWKGLAESEVSLTDGSTVRADRAYLARSIEDPDAEVVDGFTAIMPDLGLEQDQVDAIVTYIEELS